MNDATKANIDLSAPRRALPEALLPEQGMPSPAAAHTSIPLRSEDGPAPLSFAQERLWFLDRYQPGSAFYNVPVALKLTGTLDVPALQTSLNEIISRHKALRTT